jgi:hypothetical protein
MCVFQAIYAEQHRNWRLSQLGPKLPISGSAIGADRNCQVWIVFKKVIHNISAFRIHYYVTKIAIDPDAGQLF